jgi:hypothetical protein
MDVHRAVTLASSWHTDQAEGFNGAGGWLGSRWKYLSVRYAPIQEPTIAKPT